MKRWIVALGAAILGSVLVLLCRVSSPELLQDSDTRVLLAAIRARGAPLSWFTSDWPLQNHFYRPVSTLSFELDNRLYGNAAWGYGLTNALLCVACTLLLFWFLRELTDIPAVAGASSFLFALWETGLSWPLSYFFQYFAIAIAVGGALRHGFRIQMWAPAALVAWEVLLQLGTARSLDSRTLDWLPGRTAIVMTVFALAALGAYARYERLGAPRERPEPGPLDPPSTRNSTVVPAKPPPYLYLWAILAVLLTLLALGAYEQAVMLPALLLATACTFRWRGFRVRWVWQGAFWSCIGLYLLVRHQFVPSSASHYQLQQFRTGPGVWVALSAYLLPSLFPFATMSAWLSSLPISLLTAEPWQLVLTVGADVATLLRVRSRWAPTFAGFGMAFLAFLPMAWVKEFDHYHYWPEAMKSLFVTMLAWVAWDGAISAWSPRTRQAPPRLDPAPGSLPHP